TSACPMRLRPLVGIATTHQFKEEDTQGRRAWTAARASRGLAARAAACAASRHRSKDARARWLATPARPRGDIERLVAPAPTSTVDSNGSAAASPHTPTGVPVA